ncbi:Thioredoxin-like protein 4A [Triticum urartu]|uniref:Thioredoxin-like protein 4A n=1 Tax=Triticum urartu TaxID=4572 RepID=M8APB1_TRIUA|nr:Thioredoxin-like protein 4A [Triticum urartu]
MVVDPAAVVALRSQNRKPTGVLGLESGRALVNLGDMAMTMAYICTPAMMDEVLSGVAETIKNFAVIYLVDITEVPDFNTMYELYDPSTVMFFFRNKYIMIDLGTGNNNKINWAMKDKQEFVDIVETVYRGARKGRGLVIAPKDYSTKYWY